MKVAISGLDAKTIGNGHITITPPYSGVVWIKLRKSNETPSIRITNPAKTLNGFMCI